MIREKRKTGEVAVTLTGRNVQSSIHADGEKTLSLCGVRLVTLDAILILALVGFQVGIILVG